MSNAATFGVVFSGHIPLQQVLSGATLADEYGFNACWVGEDFFYHGGFSTATAIAERTERIEIGLGIVTPLPRHPALTAMEAATLDEIAHGRLLFGLGYGVPAWMEQMHLGFKSRLRAVRESVEICRRLMRGEMVTLEGSCFSLDRVKLGFTPYRTEMPIYLGFTNSKGLQLSGEIADGTVISVLASPGYLEWARENIAIGCARGNRSVERHELVVYVIFSIHEDGDIARAAVRRPVAEYLSAGAGPRPLTQLAGVPDEAATRMAEIYRQGVIPTDLVDDDIVSRVAVAGTPDECAAGVRRLIEAGASSIIFSPHPSDQIEQQLDAIHRQLLPRLANG